MDTASKKSSSDEERKTIVVGVCAMEKKANSKPMTEMLSRLQEFPRMQAIVIPQT